MSLLKAGSISQNTLIPISFAIILLAGAFWIGGLASQVSAMREKDPPSRYEFNQICSQLSDIKTGVNTVNENLLKLAQRDKQ